ncbi:ABC transporter permease [bacterium D16-51]|nr:ABC transporter permease [bacterium D16-59]RKI61056.1 ABC transporter permease [bacterium D16-51]
MNNSILTIMKKELARFFGDKKVAFSTILLPGLMIFVLYSFMGSALTSQFSVEEDYKAECYVMNFPKDDTLKMMLKEGFRFKEISSEEEVKQVKKKLQEKETDLCVVFPEDFSERIAEPLPVTSSALPPEVQIFYNSSETSSEKAFQTMSGVLNEFEGMLSNRFDLNKSDGVAYDLAKKEDTIGSIFSSMLPMLLMIFLFSGTLAVAPESIAGEKERGTIATLLVTPAKRSHIAIGKILALSIIALLSGASSTIGTVLSLPKLMGAAGDLDGSVYSVTDYLFLAVVILSTVMVFVTVLSLISAYAKSIKEAQSYATPVMILLMVVGITAMFGNGAKEELYYYCIPAYNSVQSMVRIFEFNVTAGTMLVTVVSNLAVTLLGAFVLTKMFQSERIVG